MSEKIQKPRKGCLRRVFGFGWGLFKFTVVCCLLAAVGYVIWVNYAGRKAVDQINSELISHGIHEKPAVEVHEASNAARYWMAAMDLAVEPDRKFYDSMNWPEFGTLILPSDSVKLHELVELNKPAYALVKQARPLGQCVFDLDAIDDLNLFVPIYGKNRKLLRSLEAKLYYAISIKDSELALETCIDMLAAVDVLDNVDLLISQLVRTAILTGALKSIEHLLSCMDLTSNQIQLLQAELDQRARLDMIKAYEGELRFIYSCTLDPYKALSFIRETRSKYHVNLKIIKKQPFYHWQGMMYKKPVGYPDQQWWEQLAQFGFYAYEDLCVGQKQIEGLKDCKDALHAYELLQKPGATWKQFKVLDDEDKPLHYFNCQTYFRVTLLKNVTQAALDVEKFRVTSGRWPISMNEAFNQIPVDAMNQPLQMSNIDGVLRVYSVGLDGIDHQGIGRMHDSSLKDQDDIAFRLLDPNRRNREPEPKPKQEPAATEDKPANMFD